MLFALALLLSLAQPRHAGYSSGKAAGHAAAAKAAAAAAAGPAAPQQAAGQQIGQPQFYFWNEITGELQWEDPGDTAYEDDSGLRFWVGPSGEFLLEDPNRHAYAWVEYYSEDLQRPYYYHQDTKETTWSKPADLAWRRVPRPLPPARLEARGPTAAGRAAARARAAAAAPRGAPRRWL